MTVAITHNIAYGPMPQQRLDLYHMPTAVKRPVVIIVHGGAWCLGHKEDMSEMAHYLCYRLNAICVAPEYTLSLLDSSILRTMLGAQVILTVLLIGLVAILGRRVWGGLLLASAVFCLTFIMLQALTLDDDDARNRRHPAHVMDIAHTVQWVYQHIEHYGGAPTQLYLLGHSAGAHLCTLLSLNPRFLHYVGLSPHVIRGVIALSGPYSYGRMYQSEVKRLTDISVFGFHGVAPGGFKSLSSGMEGTNDKAEEEKDREANNGREEETWRTIVDAWPLYHVPDKNVYVPPMFIATAGVDFSLISHAHDLYWYLQQRGHYAEYQHYGQTTHMTIRKKWLGRNMVVGEGVLDFLQRCLAARGHHGSEVCIRLHHRSLDNETRWPTAWKQTCQPPPDVSEAY